MRGAEISVRENLVSAIGSKQKSAKEQDTENDEDGDDDDLNECHYRFPLEVL